MSCHFIINNNFAEVTLLPPKELQKGSMIFWPFDLKINFSRSPVPATRSSQNFSNTPTVWFVRLGPGRNALLIEILHSSQKPHISSLVCLGGTPNIEVSTSIFQFPQHMLIPFQSPSISICS